MILTTLISIAISAQAGQVICPIMGSPANAKGGVTDYAGVRYAYCCAGCQGAFEKDPVASIKKGAEFKKPLGISMFDPVSQKAIDSTKAKGGFSDYNLVRYYFATADSKATFDKSPKTFATTPKMESLYCPVMKNSLKAYGEATAYADYDNVRYYLCCDGCLGAFKADPKKFIGNAKDAVSAPKVANMPKKDGSKS